jgi:hypothetical protein
VHDKSLKKKLQYTSNGTMCDVFKGSTHHGGSGSDKVPEVDVLFSKYGSGPPQAPPEAPRRRRIFFWIFSGFKHFSNDFHSIHQANMNHIKHEASKNPCRRVKQDGTTRTAKEL